MTYKDEKGNTHLAAETIGNNLYTTSNKEYILHINQNEYIDFKLMGYDIHGFVMPSLRLTGEGFLFHIPKDFVPLSKILPSAGGIRYRLTLLYELAKIIYKLQSIGYTHGNIITDMIFVSDAAKVCLLYSPVQGTNDIDAFYTIAKNLLDDFNITDNNMFDILYKISQEINSLIICTNCRASFSYINKQCPECETITPDIVKATIYDDTKERGIKILQLSSIRQFFYNTHTDFLLLDQEQKPTIECRFSNNNIAFKNLNIHEMTINGRLVPPDKVFSLKLPFSSINISFPIKRNIIRNIKIQGDI